MKLHLGKARLMASLSPEKELRRKEILCARSDFVQKGTLVSRTFAEASFGTGPQKKCAGMFLTGYLHRGNHGPGKVDAREVHKARESADIT